MQWLRSAPEQCKSNTCLRGAQGFSLGKKVTGLVYQESKRYFSSLTFIAAKWKHTAVYIKTGLQRQGGWRSAPLLSHHQKFKSSEPPCSLATRPSWTQSPPAAAASSRSSTTVRSSVTPPRFLLSWHTEALRLPACSATVCLASASSLPTPDVST